MIPTNPIDNQAMITKLIGFHKLQPCLWDKNHEDFKSAEAKRFAFESIETDMKAAFPDEANITVAHIKSKLHTLISTFKRTCKKLKFMKKNQRENHQPSLWYYPLIKEYFVDEIPKDVSLFFLMICFCFDIMFFIGKFTEKNSSFRWSFKLSSIAIEDCSF